MHSHAPTDKSAVEENAQVCLALHRCWLGAAYARGADSHEEGSLMLDDVASVVADQSATSMACGPGT